MSTNLRKPLTAALVLSASLLLAACGGGGGSSAPSSSNSTLIKTQLSTNNSASKPSSGTTNSGNTSNSTGNTGNTSGSTSGNSTGTNNSTGTTGGNSRTGSSPSTDLTQPNQPTGGNTAGNNPASPPPTIIDRDDNSLANTRSDLGYEGETNKSDVTLSSGSNIHVVRNTVQLVDPSQQVTKSSTLKPTVATQSRPSILFNKHYTTTSGVTVYVDSLMPMVTLTSDVDMSTVAKDPQGAGDSGFGSFDWPTPFSFEGYAASGSTNAKERQRSVATVLGKNWNIFSWNHVASETKAKPTSVTTATTQGSKMAHVVDYAHQGNLLDLATANSKVMVVEDEMTSMTDLDTSRVKRAYLAKKIRRKPGDENKVLTDTKSGYASHAEQVVYTIIGKPTEAQIQAAAKNPNPVVSGLLSKNGSVYFLGYKQDEATMPAKFSQLISSSQFRDRIDEGYNVVSVSWGPRGQTKDEIKAIFEANRDVFAKTASNKVDGFDTVYAKHNSDLVKTLKELGITQNYANQVDLVSFNTATSTRTNAADKAALFVFAMGNEGRNTYNLFGLTMLSERETYKSLAQNSIFVTGYNPNSYKDAQGKVHSAEAYATPCGYNKFSCVAAYDEVTINYSKDTIAKYPQAAQGTTPFGTSFSAPYVAATAALVKGVFPFMTNTNLQTTVLTTAQDIGDPGVDDVYGWGVVQPQVAVNGPKQILYGQMLLDLGLNNKVVGDAPGKTYVFSNALGGAGDLIVESSYQPHTLTLSNINTYTGYTYVRKGATLNVTGTISRTPVIEVSDGATLSGSGQVGRVHNFATVMAYDPAQLQTLQPQIVTDPNKITSDASAQQRAQGLGVFSKYYQDSQATLRVLLGQPLVVYGEAQLAGTLQVDGVAKALLTDEGELLDDVLVARKDITGMFENVTSTSPLLTIDAEHKPTLIKHTYLLGKDGEKKDQFLNAVVLKVKYTQVGKALASLEGYADLTKPAQDYAFVGAQNLDALYGELQTQARNSKLTLASSDAVDLAVAENSFNWGTSLFAAEATERNTTATETTTPVAANNEATPAGTDKAGDATGEVTATDAATDNNTADSSTETTPAPSSTSEANSNSTSNTQSPLEQLLANLQSSHSGQAIIETALAFSGGEFTSMLHHNKLLTLQALTAGSKQFYHVGADDQLESNVGVNYFNGTDGGQVVNTQADVSYVYQGHKLGASFFTGSSNWYHTLSPKSNSDRYAGALLGYAVMLQERFGLNLVAGYTQHDNKLMRDLNVLGKVYNFQDDLKLREYILGANLFNTYTKDGNNFMAYYGVNKHYSYLEGFGEQFDGFSLNVGKQKFSNLYMQLGLRYNYNDLLHVNGLSLEADYNFNHSLRRWYAMHANLTDAKLSVGQRFLNQNELGIHQVSLGLTQQLDPTWSVTGKLSLLKQKEVYRNVGLELNAKF